MRGKLESLLQKMIKPLLDEEANLILERRWYSMKVFS
jgi:hypothetical protein